MRIINVDLAECGIKVYASSTSSLQANAKSVDNFIDERDIIVNLMIPQVIKLRYSIKSTIGWINNFKTFDLIKGQNMCLRLHAGEILSLERKNSVFIHLINQPQKDKKNGYLRLIVSSKPLTGSICLELEDMRKEIKVDKNICLDKKSVKNYLPGDWSPSDSLIMSH